MSDEGQQTLMGGFDEADRLDDENAPYFKPATNNTYTLTFVNVKDKPDDRHPHWKIVTRPFKDFQNPAKEVMKPVLIVWVETSNGKPVDKEWSAISKKLRDQLELACTTGSLLRKKYVLKIAGEGKEKTYSIAEAGDR